MPSPKLTEMPNEIDERISVVEYNQAMFTDILRFRERVLEILAAGSAR